MLKAEHSSMDSNCNIVHKNTLTIDFQHIVAFKAATIVIK